MGTLSQAPGRSLRWAQGASAQAEAFPWRGHARPDGRLDTLGPLPSAPSGAAYGTGAQQATPAPDAGAVRNFPVLLTSK